MTDLPDRLATLSPAKRALLLQRLRSSAGAPPIPRIADGPAPLTAEQRRLWYLLQLAPGQAIYTIPLGFRLRGNVDVDALVGALKDLVARHETLRMRFRESAGIPVQEPTDGGAFSPGVVDLRGDEWAEAEANYQAGAFARRPFDLSRGETFRALLLREKDDDFRLLLDLHHIAADGWSTLILMRDLSALYASRVAGVEPDLPPVAVRYRDWAAWQQRPDRPGASADEEWWSDVLAGAPTVLDLPADHPRPAVQRWEGEKHAFNLSGELAARVRDLARSEGTTAFAVLAAAFALVLHRYSAQDDLLLGTPLANRTRPELESVPGFFVATLPMRVRLGGDPTAAELIRRTHDAAVGAQEHASVPFDRLVEIVAPQRDFSRPPLVQAVFGYADAPATALALPGVRVEPLLLDGQTAIFDVTMLAEDRGDHLGCVVQYSTALFDASTAQAMARHFAGALEAFAADPHRPVSSISLATEDETRVVGRWCAGPSPDADLACIHALFERQARATPDRVALVFGDGEITYAELNRRANRIAHGLRARGAGPEARVAVCLERTPSLVAALLGVLKSGAAYVPMDPAQPAARHQSILRTAGARWAIVDSPRDFGEVETIDVRALDDGREDDPPPAATPENLAYVIFTSGSTGGPKGVEIEHRSAAVTLGWMRDLLTDDERACVLGSSQVTFDVSLAEIFATLCWGGTLVLVENALSPIPAGREVRAAAMVPTAAAERLRAGDFPPSIETVLLGGEPVPPALVNDLHRAPSVRRVLNLYGPTEDTTYSTWAELEPGEDRVSIGRPVAGGRVYVLDPALRHAGVAAPGEVWTAGAGVARGYAGRPALTAERFVPDPHGPPGSRMYRTLDRGRWRADGTLDYLGRADAQVKVRGYRIELEEVEQALESHPAVGEAAATVQGSGPERRLVAFLVPAGQGAPPSIAELRAWVRERLPEYMVPTAWTWTDALPRTGSGKLDRRALPEPGDGAMAEVPYVAPRTPLEARLAELWEDVLGVPRVGVHDDFFDLGGQSILATRLVARVREETGAEITVASLLTAPTLEEMAKAVEGRASGVRLPLVALQTFGDRPPLFLAHPAGGHVVCYRELGALLAPDQPAYALQPLGALDGRAPLSSIEEMAAYYVDAVRAFRPDGPYRVGGWSFGGVVAWEMAQQLAAAGEEVDLLAIFDTGPLGAALVEIDPRDPADVVWNTVAGLAGHAAATRVSVDELRGLDVRDAVLTMIRKMAAPTLPEDRADEVLALTALRAANLNAQAEYTPRPYAGHLTYFRTTGSETTPALASGLEYWSRLAVGGTTVHRVVGSHGTILMEPAVYALVEGVLAAGHARVREAERADEVAEVG